MQKNEVKDKTFFSFWFFFSFRAPKQKSPDESGLYFIELSKGPFQHRERTNQNAHTGTSLTLQSGCRAHSIIH